MTKKKVFSEKMQSWQEESSPFIIILFIKFKKISWQSGLFETFYKSSWKNCNDVMFGSHFNYHFDSFFFFFWWMRDFSESFLNKPINTYLYTCIKCNVSHWEHLCLKLSWKRSYTETVGAGEWKWGDNSHCCCTRAVRTYASGYTWNKLWCSCESRIWSKRHRLSHPATQSNKETSEWFCCEVQVLKVQMGEWPLSGLGEGVNCTPGSALTWS